VGLTLSLLICLMLSANASDPTSPHPAMGEESPSVRSEPAPDVTLRVVWLNDGLAGLKLPGGHRLTPIVIDDNGFTNGFELSATIGNERRWLTLDARILNIVERPPSGVSPAGLRRWDSLDFVVGLARAGSFGALRWSLAPHVGLALGGNYGGLWMQNGLHEAIGERKRTEGQRLQTRYVGPARAGLTLGIAATSRVQLLSWASARGDAEAQAASGDTGVSRLSGKLGLEVARSFGIVRPSLSVFLEAAAVRTADPGLLIPGGYSVHGAFLMPGLTIGLAVGAVAFGWGMVLNEGGSGYPNGALFVEVTTGRRAR